MLGKSPNQKQGDLFRPLLEDFIDSRHELVLLAKKIDWKHFEETFSSLYSHTGQPSQPIRLMVGCLLLKRLYNLGDETLAGAWVMNPYMQYFCGEAHFQHQFPFDPSDFVHFRKRIGAEGVEKIFQYSLAIQGQEAHSKVVISDTTVQENNTTYPTDAKQYKKIIQHCQQISQQAGFSQRQSYARVSKQLLRDCYNSQHPKRRKQAQKSRKKLRTIARRVLREVRRHLSPEQTLAYQEKLALFERVLAQEKKDKNKIYKPAQALYGLYRQR